MTLREFLHGCDPKRDGHVVEFGLREEDGVIHGYVATACFEGSEQFYVSSGLCHLGSLTRDLFDQEVLSYFNCMLCIADEAKARSR